MNVLRCCPFVHLFDTPFQNSPNGHETVLDKVCKKMKKQGIKSFFKPVSTNSNVAKETDPVERLTSVEVPSKLSRNTETEIVN